MLFKCFRYDFKCGIIGEYKKYIISTILFLIIGIDFYFKDVAESFGDFLFYFFYGMEEFIPSPGAKFRFPALWIAVMVFVSYITLYYPYRDMNGYGKSILISSGNKKLWFLSKSLWVMASTFIYFLLAFIVLLLVAVLSGAKVDFSVCSSTIMKLIPYITTQENLFYENGAFYNVSIIHFLTPVFISVSINLFQMVLSLFIKPFYSFTVTVSYLIAGAYYMNPLLIGNFAMIGRSNIFLSNGMNFNIGLIISMVIIAIVICLGIFIFSKQDILNKEGA